MRANVEQTKVTQIVVEYEDGRMHTFSRGGWEPIAEDIEAPSCMTGEAFRKIVRSEEREWTPDEKHPDGGVWNAVGEGKWDAPK